MSPHEGCGSPPAAPPAACMRAPAGLMQQNRRQELCMRPAGGLPQPSCGKEDYRTASAPGNRLGAKSRDIFRQDCGSETDDFNSSFRDAPGHTARSVPRICRAQTSSRLTLSTEAPPTEHRNNKKLLSRSECFRRNNSLWGLSFVSRNSSTVCHNSILYVLRES